MTGYRTSYFLIALAKLYDEKQPAEECLFQLVIPESAFVWLPSKGAIVASGWSRKLGDQIFDHKHKAKRAKWKCGKAMNSENPRPVTYPPNSTASWGTKCSNTRVSGHFLFKPPQMCCFWFCFAAFFFFLQNCLSTLSFVSVYVNTSC